MGIIAWPQRFFGVNSSAKIAKKGHNGRASAEFQIAVGLRFRTVAAHRTKIKRTVAATSNVLHARHGGAAKFTLPFRTLGHLSLNALRNSAFP